MAKLKLKSKDLRKIGFPESPAISVAMQVMEKYYKFHSLEAALEILQTVLDFPEEYMEHEVLGKIANALVEKAEPEREEIALREEPIPYHIYGKQHIEPGAMLQMDVAVRLPIARGAALMPDAHQGYGLPIGGVLAVENAVIPYGVGVDIGCRMSLSILSMTDERFLQKSNILERALRNNTKFGTGKEFKFLTEHPVFEDEAFQTVPILRNMKERASRQLGTSGSGNHFVEFGIVDLTSGENEWNLPKGKYVGLLSHSGSRSVGANVAQYYTQIAMDTCLLPRNARHLAYLSLDSEAGMEYWIGMNLAGDYAAACHDTIHQRIVGELGCEILARIENHHNFAWKEQWLGNEVVVHRKGATPAGKGVLGIIPGSMTAPGFIVKGKGEPLSINSAAHGAGRRMSRGEAMQNITHNALRTYLEKHNVILLGGGLDEAPFAYKDIHEVMKSQSELVEVLATFQPRIVRMDA
ncbi:MAG: RtcB family protein [Bacteroidia bacterium]